MNHQILLLALLLCYGNLCLSQTHIRNRGAHIHISQSSQMIVSGDIMNLTASGQDGKWHLGGELQLKGDWENHALSPDVFPFSQPTGRLRLVGDQEIQLLGGSEPTELGWLILDNPYGVLLSQEFTISKRMSLWQGKLDASIFPLHISNPTPGIIDSVSEDRYIIGSLRRTVGNEAYLFPIGTADHLQSAQLTIMNSQSLPYVEAEFIESQPIPPPSLEFEGASVREFLDNGYWSVRTPPAAWADFDLQLRSVGHQNGGSDPRQHAIYSRGGQQWKNLGTHDNATQSGSGSAPIVAFRSNLTEFGDFAIGRSDYVLQVDPGITPTFGDFSVGDNGVNARSWKIRFSASSPSPFQLSLFDYQGKLLWQESGNAQTGLNERELDVTPFAKSVYLLQLEKEGEIHRVKVW